MRLQMTYRILLVLVFVTGMSACEKGFDELNQNPNVPTEGAPEELFAYAQFKYHTDYSHGVLTEIWGLNSWMQVQANINGIASVGDEYFISGDATNNTWKIFYADVLGNVNEAIRLTGPDPEKINEQAIYRIFRAYMFLRLTDLWGAIPYSEALNVINDQNEPDFTPVYDSQSSIYMDILSELELASEALDSASPSIGVQDHYYQGDVDRWRRFANSLRLRMAMRISDVEPEMAQQILQELVSEGELILDDFESAGFPHNGAARSPFYELDNTAQGMYHPGAFLLDMLVSDQDPRVSRYADHSPESVIFGTFQYVGVESFMLSSEIDPNVINDFTRSYINEYFLDAELKSNVFSASETHFLLAESALKGWASLESAQVHYENGVRSHMERLGVEQDEIEVYLNAAGAFDGSLEQIITEKWKTFVYTDAIELYNEWRRTGYPIILNAEGEPVDENNVPKRLAYPATEVSLNAENVAAVGYGINDFSTPMWWDVQ